MYSFPYLEPVWCSMSSSNCFFLTCIQVSQEAGQEVWYSHFLKNFPVCCDPHSQRLWHSNKEEVDVFLELSCFFYDPTDVGNLTSGSTAFSKSSLNIWKFIVHVLLKPGEGNGKPLQCSCSETPWTEDWLSMTTPLFCCRFFTKSLWVWTAYIHNFLENRRVNCPCCKSFCPFSTLHEQLRTIYPIICLNISWNDFTNETKWAVGFFVSPFILIDIRC